jgi:Arc/MetJ family transcription regulator
VKHLIDVDDDLLKDAMCQMGTKTIKATIEAALQRAIELRRAELHADWVRFGELAEEIPLVDRSEAW